MSYSPATIEPPCGSAISDFDDLIQQIKTCTLCGLSEQRTNAVPGEGSSAADVMFIGEGPGSYEDRDGRPFVGPAGQVLDEMLSSAGLRRSDVYITNMVKCRPPNNRDPLPGEITACRKYLDRQIELLQPKVIVTLGRFSLAQFFPNESISRAHGRPRAWNGHTVMPMYHPAAALHQGNMRGAIEEDFRKLPEVIRASAAAPQEPPEPQAPEPEQLSMF